MDSELTLEHIKNLLTDSATSIHQQAMSLYPIDNAEKLAGYTELSELMNIFVHCANAIEQGCFVQVKAYVPNPALMPVEWKDV